jgi:DUF917 family protein
VTKIHLNKDLVEAAVLGGAVLGGGGGGSMADGRRNGLLAVEWGAPDLVDLDDLPGEAMLVTASAVGSPAAKSAYALPAHYVRAVELLRDLGGVRIQGVITSENGGVASTNGWVQAAALGVPVVDAPCNGRAHPMGIMGSMGLHDIEGYMSLQTVAGGNPLDGRYLEMLVRGRLDKASAMVLQSAIQSGGMVAVARNPVQVSYARDHAAMLEKQDAGPAAVVEAACESLGGEIVGRGQVVEVKLETRGGLDVGTVRVATGDREVLELTFWNEYMTLEVVDQAQGPRRIGTFPDLITTLDLSSGLPLSSAMVAEGQQVAVLYVHRNRLILGAGMRYPGLMRAVEETVGKEVIKYVFP